jgi:hypothetical protein
MRPRDINFVQITIDREDLVLVRAGFGQDSAGRVRHKTLPPKLDAVTAVWFLQPNPIDYGDVATVCHGMAALDDFEIQGDTLKFNILHEDWGDGELPTFFKHVTAHIGWNEMRITTTADHQPPPRPAPAGVVPGSSLTGPIPVEATSGNRWPEWPPKNTSLPH